jgi:hypothetical protein
LAKLDPNLSDRECLESSEFLYFEQNAMQFTFKGNKKDFEIFLRLFIFICCSRWWSNLWILEFHLRLVQLLTISTFYSEILFLSKMFFKNPKQILVWSYAFLIPNDFPHPTNGVFCHWAIIFFTWLFFFNKLNNA